MQKNGDYLIGEIKDICKKQPGNHFKSEIRDSSRVAPNVDDILKNKTKQNQRASLHSTGGSSHPCTGTLVPGCHRCHRWTKTFVTGPSCLSSLSRKVSWHEDRWDKALLEPFTSSYFFKAALDCIRHLFRKTSCSLWWLSKITSYFTGF